MTVARSPLENGLRTTADRVTGVRRTPAGVVIAKIAVFAACLLPAALLVVATFRNQLGPDPVAQITHETGIWALRLLLATLALTPLRQLTGSSVPIRFRRMLGLFAFFYAVLHLSTYVVLDLRGYWPQILDDIVKRPYITVGALALLMLIPLAVTSTRGMMRRLGRNWGRLHRLVYPAAALACLHFFWLVKADKREPLIYAGIFALLMVFRLPWKKRAISRGSTAGPTPAPR